MKTTFSPRELARAIGVSESSLKRWIDDGRLEVIRTPGGHRRVPLEAAIKFVQDNHLDLAEPAALGLVEVGKAIGDAGEKTDGEILHDLLLKGDAETARSLVLTAFIKGMSIAEICDGPLLLAMHKIGRLWNDDPDGIFLEHRATDIALETLRSLRLGIRVDGAAPTALGGAPEGDPYAMPSLMAATVLRSVGFQTTNLGPETPLDSLLRAARETEASLVWLSVSLVAKVEQLSERLNWLFGELRESGIELIVGGRELDRLVLDPGLSQQAFVGSMKELADLGSRLLASRV